jgi:hypothetical protein
MAFGSRLLAQNLINAPIALIYPEMLISCVNFTVDILVIASTGLERASATLAQSPLIPEKLP